MCEQTRAAHSGRRKEVKEWQTKAVEKAQRILDSTVIQSIPKVGKTVILRGMIFAEADRTELEILLRGAVYTEIVGCAFIGVDIRIISGKAQIHCNAIMLAGADSEDGFKAIVTGKVEYDVPFIVKSNLY